MIRIPYVKPRLHADGGYRPRWEPGPRQRALGFTATDLKHADGRWFSLEEAAAYANKMLAEVQARTAAPSSAPKLPRKAGKSVGDLLDGYFASTDFAEQAPTTRQDYLQKANAIRWRRRTREEIEAGVERLPEPFALAPARLLDRRVIRDFYLHLRDERGLQMARSVIMVLSSAWKWASYSSGWEMLPRENPCHQLNLTKAPARVRTWPVDGVSAMLAAAEAAGKPSIGDAMMIALYSGQRQNDVLSLVDRGADPIFGSTKAGASSARKAAAGEALRFLQNKTKVRVAIFAAPDLVARLARAEERRAAIVAKRKVVSLKGGDLPVVMNSRGNAWFPGAFRKAFRTIRDRVAAERPELGIGDLHFQDLRDTAVTWLGNAGCTTGMVCSFTGHTLENAERILRHYMARTEAMAREAGAKQVAWLEREGISL